ncbi:aldehyde dehydrogenase family protein [Corynebacterium terpenotabidum]|uniref:Succinic-semialdehyde dehydrogenase n=1 Tax=Corynebacterium terpenotabidum Y-11 TaxID=1200352 RepID=S4XB97_9CORY|nr:aldehyde dehydrogenase family protein [Corynebacterium terpenotabidum]AGP29739.1 succinic-semialdehyde dehydrogenase [Corynebacterium terpenotabidum Y-11]
MTTSPVYRTTIPATGEVTGEHPHLSDAELRSVLADAAAAAATWRAVPIAERAAVVTRIAALFTERAAELGALATAEMGKPLGESVGEADFSGNIFSYYADNGPALAADQVLEDSEESRIVVQRRPVGVLLGIMPWNYPYYQIARFAAPNLVTGNVILLKHAESVPGCALVVEEIIRQALREGGYPEAVYTNIFATHDQISTVIEDPRVQGVSLTGSERAGAAIAAQAGAALKKVVLELGGSDPYVILSTDDVKAAAATAVAIRLENTGQACNSNKRIIVSAEIYEEFVDEAVALVSALTPKDPAQIEDYTQEKAFAPLSSERAADTLVDQIGRAVDAGATLRVGGTRLGGDFASGFYVAPAVLTDIPVGTPIAYEEFFGPVVSVFKVSSDEEALALANDTQYGLGSTVFATEPGRAEKFAEGLEAGMTGVNQSAPETESMPFGGVKRSGYGRELGPLGMDEFVNKRLYAVKK